MYALNELAKENKEGYITNRIDFFLPALMDLGNVVDDSCLR